MNLKRNWIFILSISLFSLASWGWGPLGHQTSAEIAYRMFDQKTRSKVNRLLRGKTMAEASNWADAVRAELPEWKYTVWYHFESIPDKVTYLNNLKLQNDEARKNGGLIEALYLAEDLMRHSPAVIDRENGLKFLIHFIGDLHQPLHTGRTEDNGGNKVPVKWLGRDANLHQVWDSLVISLAHKNFLDGESYEDQYEIYADYLQKKFKNFRVTPDLFTRYDDWMHESMVPRDDAYKFRELSEHAYAQKFSELIDQRVYLAALRINHTVARILNTIEPSPSDPLTKLRHGIISIVGQFTEFLKLRPEHTTGHSLN